VQKPAPAPSGDERAKREAAPAELLKAPQPPAASAPPPPSPPAQDAIVREQNATGALIGGAERPAPEARAEMRRADEGARAASVLSGYAMQSPEQWLQGIADLRRQGRDEEADKELAEFRKRNPDYRIPQQVREQVERKAR